MITTTPQMAAGSANSTPVIQVRDSENPQKVRTGEGTVFSHFEMVKILPFNYALKTNSHDVDYEPNARVS